ncbi:hypothetical protein NP493_458g03055 [Ridgeia piscesae]|uniref:Calcium signal-modulating cyclophilin ligand n=1 Tax=Ridgeia piscesae TaxID=27915 RepID=A0AAD9NTI2_RIDPI|nr:hypothetical protein NP493_458g03055 [Ridgeia piscesae]
MSELQSSSNAADMAKQRREQRRRRLLMTSEERMRKIMGLSEESISEKQDSPETAVQPSVLPNSSLHEAADVPHIAQTEVSQEETQQQTTSHTHPRNRKVQHSSVLGTSTLDDSTTSLLSGGGDPLRGEPTTSVEPPKQDSMLLAFRKFRTMFVLLVGFLVRVAFMYDFGKLYIQTILNPFVALEISILGFQKSAGMEFGGQANRGIISALILLGVRQPIINIYKQVLGASTDVCQDFALYFFAFVITHVLI